MLRNACYLQSSSVEGPLRILWGPQRHPQRIVIYSHPALRVPLRSSKASSPRSPVTPYGKNMARTWKTGSPTPASTVCLIRACLHFKHGAGVGCGSPQGWGLFHAQQQNRHRHIYIYIYIYISFLDLFPLPVPFSFVFLYNRNHPKSSNFIKNHKNPRYPYLILGKVYFCRGKSLCAAPETPRFEHTPGIEPGTQNQPKSSKFIKKWQQS